MKVMLCIIFVGLVFGPLVMMPSTEATTVKNCTELSTPTQELHVQFETFLQSVQTYNGKQLGPPYVDNISNLTSQFQTLIDNMNTTDFATCSANLSSLQSKTLQEAVNWAKYVAKDQTTIVDPRLSLNTSAQQLLTDITTLLQNMWGYNRSQTKVPLFVTNAETAVNETQKLVKNIMTIDYATSLATFSSLQSKTLQEAVTWAKYVAEDQTTIVDPRLSLNTLAQQLLDDINALLKKMQSYNVSQTVVVTNAETAVNETQKCTNMTTNDFTSCLETLTKSQDSYSQLSTEWTAYCVNNPPPKPSPPPTTTQPTTTKPVVKSSNSGWWIFLYVIIGLIVAVLLGIGGYILYKKKFH